MTEEESSVILRFTVKRKITESSTSDFDPLHFVLKQNDNIIQLQFKFMEEMKKTSLLEEKNISVQNDMKILTKDINQFMGEKEKFVTKLEEKNLSLENEINKKIQKLNSDHENEIRELKQTFKQLIDDKIKEIENKFLEEKGRNENEKKIIEGKNGCLENEMKILKEELQQLIDGKIKENTNQISNLNQIIEQKDEKIISLEEQFNQIIQKIQFENENKIEEIKQNFQQLFGEIKDNQILEKINLSEEEIKKVNELFGKRIEDLTIKLEQFFKFTCKFVNFMQIKNKWKEIFNLNDTSNDNDFYNCCEKKCINTNKVTGNCVKQNGFVNITSDINIRYINSVSGGGHDKSGRVIAENKFENPQNCINYSLFYFEIKCQITEARNLSQSFAIIGLTNGNKRVRFITNKSLIKNEKDEEFTVTLSRNSADVYGCGLVYPPNNRMAEEFPYIFFTQNGKQIGKAVHLKENFDLVFKPFVTLKCFSVDTNFGQDLKAKPFSYDITRHFILNEFY